ncbi:unnamed protein product [Phytophthora fragariaefolia]|uniref:Unnamed protein product n=1 Tax=Phytophthora fragariaefolia TaxID=1490495 RepID=A0A9W6WT26_9STRA|nr:unnamed protein product [Phytophthora fragariaefolia]
MAKISKTIQSLCVVSTDDDDELSDSDAVQMDQAFIDSLLLGSGELTDKPKKERKDALRATQWTEASAAFEVGGTAYAGMTNALAHHVAELRGFCQSALLTFLYLMPKSMWVMINAETNRYALHQVDRRARVLHAKQRDRRTETAKQIKRRLKLKNT